MPVSIMRVLKWATHYWSDRGMSRNIICGVCLAGAIAIAIGIWRLRAPIDQSGLIKSTANQQVLEFQTTCDITLAFFDSTGLSVASSVPVLVVSLPIGDQQMQLREAA